jgi:selenocysteine lyase/cysteine desulfurase
MPSRSLTRSPNEFINSNTVLPSEVKTLYTRPEGIYALAHSVGPMCSAAKTALYRKFIQPWEAFGGDAWPVWLEQIKHFNAGLSCLLNADADDFCPQPSVSLAFSQWLAAISKMRDTKQLGAVVMHEDAFASLGFAVSGLSHTYNIELRLISSPANDIQAWEQALAQPDVFACVLTHAHSNTGELTDVARVLEIARQYKRLSAVDIAQSVGIIPIDLQTWHADCVVGSCVKWLSGGPGAAFLYIPAAKARNLNPDHLAWFSHENPFEFDIRHFTPADSVLRFWGGTPSIAPYVMAAAAIEQHNNYGTRLFRAHNLRLMQQFLLQYPHHIPPHYQSLLSDNLAHDLDAELCSNTDYPPAHSATLCLPIPPRHSSKIGRQLDAEKIKFDERNGTIRLSFSAVNRSDDIDVVAAAFSLM